MTTSSASTLQNGQFTCSMTDPFLIFMKGEVRKIEKKYLNAYVDAFTLSSERVEIHQFHRHIVRFHEQLQQCCLSRDIRSFDLSRGKDPGLFPLFQVYRCSLPLYNTRVNHELSLARVTNSHISQKP